MEFETTVDIDIYEILTEAEDDELIDEIENRGYVVLKSDGREASPVAEECFFFQRHSTKRSSGMFLRISQVSAPMHRMTRY